ncbi:tRNA-splicing endonuclease subunit sen15 [Plakobranchus ocellatus]|uniref:tRNA-splicing endonuclease subunit sen15 n=1 Tax=Plakobranchus ocellatus TaxID=259542 RepID=A0AAV3YKW3_9GAST|nr:tRNA-splicing endonuclease subunit sen15 [Plakobranchus ocellatus]
MACGGTEDMPGVRHPLLEDFLQQNPGCDEESAERAFLVYQDLTEVRGWWFTELAFSDALERPYVTGQKSRRLPRQAVLPVSVEERISLHDVQTFFCKIYASGALVKSLTLAVNDLDSTVVYYKLTSGLSPPDPPDVTVQRKQDKDVQFDRKRRHVAACVRQFMEQNSAAFPTSTKSLTEEEL